MQHGLEWVVEAYGCRPEALTSLDRMQRLFSDLVEDLGLHPVGQPVWHRFPGAGGITGLALLAESHLACHSFPEHGTLTLNLFCCRPRPEWEFDRRLKAAFGATEVRVRRLERAIAAVEVAQ
jgi:S-adenosylmethionine decarboxylase